LFPAGRVVVLLLAGVLSVLFGPSELSGLPDHTARNVSIIGALFSIADTISMIPAPINTTIAVVIRRS
jgi:hypothetical protein